MTQDSPERQHDLEGDTLRKNSEITFPSAYGLDFIGPHDATDEARPLLRILTAALARIAVLQTPAYE